MKPNFRGASAERSTPARFITPFKAGMRPGEAGWVGIASPATKGKGKEKDVTHVDTIDYDLRRSAQKEMERWKVFDLRKFSALFLNV